ncbi:ankyrin repeat-containing domain protein [Trichoderma gracile]
MRDAQDSAGRFAPLSSVSRHGGDYDEIELPKESPLSLAAQQGDTERVKQLLEDPDADADLNAVDRYGDTPLTYVARSGRVEIVKMMVKEKNKIDADNYQNAFVAAAEASRRTDSVLVLELLLATFNIDVNATNANGSTALHRATANRNTDAVEFLLKTNGSDINKKDKSDSTAVDIAIEVGNRHAIELLLPSAWDANLENSILEAARSGHHDLLDSLLANFCALVDGHLDPLIWAALRGHVEVLQILLTRDGANANAMDRNSRTAISWAAQGGRADAVDLLLEYGADASLPDRGGNTPLWYALSENEEETAKKLIPLDTSTLQTLICQNRLDWIKLMMRLGTNLEQKGKNGQTALHVTAEWGRLDIAKALLSAGANINAEDYSGMTPLRAALIRREADLARELLKRRASNTGIMSKDWHLISKRGDEELILLSEAFDGERHLDFPEAIDDCWSLFMKYPQRKTFLIPLTDGLNSSVWTKVPFKIPEKEELTANDLRIDQASDGFYPTVSIALWLPLDQFSADRLSEYHGAQASRIIWSRPAIEITRRQTVLLSTLPFVCIPDDCVDLFRQFLTHTHTQWLELCRRAGDCLSQRRADQLMFRGKNVEMMDDLAKDAHKLAGLRLSLASQISKARKLMEEFSELKLGPYDTRRAVLKLLEEEFETGIKTKLDELDQIARDLLQIEFAWTSIREARTATRLGQNVMLLTYVSIFYLPLGFCAALWAIPNITYNSTRLPFIITACCVSLLTLLVSFNMEKIAAWSQQGYRYCRTHTPSNLLEKIPTALLYKILTDLLGKIPTDLREKIRTHLLEKIATDLPKKVSKHLLEGTRKLLGKMLQRQRRKKTEDPKYP